MNLSIFWKNIEIVKVFNINNMYISNIDIYNYQKAKNDGMPFFLLYNLETFSSDIPSFIKSRIPEEHINNYTEYIKNTKCKCETDKFSIDVFYN